MKTTLNLLEQDFESSTTRTPQYLQFHRTFKREFKKLLASYTTRIEISKPNHFDVSGFFQMVDGRIYYISLGDLRWDKNELLIRTAKDFKDYTGGGNNFISLNENFVDSLFSFLRVENKRSQ